MDLKEIALHLQDFRNVYVTGNPAMLRSRTDFLDIFSAYGLAADMSVSKKTGLLIVCSDPMQTVLMWVVWDKGKKEEARRGQRHHLCPLLVP